MEIGHAASKSPKGDFLESQSDCLLILGFLFPSDFSLPYSLF